jgi:hypothetical protein
LLRLPEWRVAFEAFLANPGPWDFLVPWARDTACLPVYCDWTHAIGVAEDGGVFAIAHERGPRDGGPPDGELSDVRLLNVALRSGMGRYPWLEALLPRRPSDARECSTCRGTGRLPAPSGICYCGGAGWVPASDRRASPRILAKIAK